MSPSWISLFNFYYRMITNSFGNETIRLFTQYIEEFPILSDIKKVENDINKYVLKIMNDKDNTSVNEENLSYYLFLSLSF